MVMTNTLDHLGYLCDKAWCDKGTSSKSTSQDLQTTVMRETKSKLNTSNYISIIPHYTQE